MRNSFCSNAKNIKRQRLKSPLSNKPIEMSFQYTGDGRNERVNFTSFAEAFNIIHNTGFEFLNSSLNVWCIDPLVALAPAVNYNYVIYSADELSRSLSNNAIATWDSQQYSNNEQMLRSVSWLLNQFDGTITDGDPTLPDKFVVKEGAEGLNGLSQISMGDIQSAVWKILEQWPFRTASDIRALETYSEEISDQLTSAALLYGANFEANSSELSAIIIVDNITGFEEYGFNPGTLAQPQIATIEGCEVRVWVNRIDVRVSLLRDLNFDGIITSDEVVRSEVGSQIFLGSLIPNLNYRLILSDVESGALLASSEIFALNSAQSLEFEFEL